MQWKELVVVISAILPYNNSQEVLCTFAHRTVLQFRALKSSRQQMAPYSTYNCTLLLWTRPNGILMVFLS
jgi:hypothetical protein